MRILCAQAETYAALQPLLALDRYFPSLLELEAYLCRQAETGVLNASLLLDLDDQPLKAHFHNFLARLHALSGQPVSLLASEAALTQLDSTQHVHIQAILKRPFAELEVATLARQLSQHEAQRQLVDEQTRRLGLLVHENRMLQQRLREESPFEPGTGLLHRQALLNCLHKEWRRAHRYQQPLSAIALSFETAQADSHAYAQFENTLIKRLKAVRSFDIVAHYAPQTFILLLPMTFSEGVQALSAHFRSRIYLLLRQYGLEQVTLTLQCRSEIPQGHQDATGFLQALLQPASAGSAGPRARHLTLV
ncbi:MAG: GGDEF domain-containing protein [Candidatus Sericytochromatia bacterium]|nr:GGDEF domain-containing protein [Candidatus Sericytochromatia bacterium]